MDLDTNRYTDPVPLGGDQVAPPLPPHDLDTGEVLPPLEQDGPIPEHAAAPQPRPQSPQEVFPPQLAAGGGYAQDGAVIPGLAVTSGQFLDLIDDGQFSQDAYAKIRDCAKTMINLSRMTNAKQKGKVTITIDLEAEDETFKMTPNIVVKKPEPPKRRSVMWADENGQFTRFPPNQTQLFGLRQSNPAR